MLTVSEAGRDESTPADNIISGVDATLIKAPASVGALCNNIYQHAETPRNTAL